jgi:TRAP-type C4-dicarboxylate transport system permease small subunit
MIFLGKLIDKITSKILIVSLTTLIFLSLIEIIFRQFQITFLWISPIVRHLVLLSSLMGAVLAIGKRKHIRIDILSRISKGKHTSIIEKLMVAFSTAICVWLFIASLEFLQLEIEYGREVIFKIHSSHLAFIIPFSFALMSLRFFIHLFEKEEV